MNKWEVVIFHGGKRIVKSVDDAKEGLAIVEKLKVKQVSAHLVSRRKAFPPKNGFNPDGQLWCPYCRRYREFRIPRGDEHAPLNSYAWQNSILARLEVSICPWCGITSQEFYVKMYNNLWAVDRRRRAKKPGRRHRVRR